MFRKRSLPDVLGDDPGVSFVLRQEVWRRSPKARTASSCDSPCDERMPDLEKEEAIALFEDGNRSVELVRDWSPEALADLIASINWNYQGAREVKGELQSLYEQRRSEEAHRNRVRRVWGLAVAAVVVAILMLVLWEEYG